jgi:hypothetical protein
MFINQKVLLGLAWPLNPMLLGLTCSQTGDYWVRLSARANAIGLGWATGHNAIGPDWTAKYFQFYFFCLFRFFFSYLIFFSYGKEKINWWDFLYCINVGWWLFFSFKVGLNFLIKTCLLFKNALKNFDFFKLFYLIQINIFFDIFVLFWCDDIKNKF